MTQAAKAQEPSMEEILASIRRIIADDDGSKSAAPAPSAARPAPTPAPPPPAPASPVTAFETPVPKLEAQIGNFPTAEETEILDLTEPVEPAATEGGFRTIEPAQDLMFDEVETEAEPPPEPEMSGAERMGAALDSLAAETQPARPAAPSTVDLARRQFERETGEERSLLSNNTTAAVDSAFNSLAQTVLVQNSRTLDDLVREMLRPMLKAWLDDNLPNMVERLVRAEIDRVSRGRG
ncbi:MAG: PopZ family protein [Xanthobacteraceae bacterium]